MSNTMSGKEGRKESEGISGGRNGPCGRQSPGCQGIWFEKCWKRLLVSFSHSRTGAATEEILLFLLLG